MPIRYSKITAALLFIGLFFLQFTNGFIGWRALGLSFVILFMLIAKINITQRALIESLFFLILLAISLLRFEFFLRTEVAGYQAEAVVGNTAKYILLIITWCLLRSIVSHEKAVIIKKQIINLLRLNVAYFYLQFTLMFVTGFYLDLGQYITGIESRHRGIIYSGHGLGTFRATGLFVEPSNYFFVVLALLSLIFLFSNAKKYRTLFVFTIISMFLTLSTAAIVVGTFFLVYFLYKQKVDKKIYLTLGMVILVSTIYMAPQLNAIYNKQISRSKGGAGDMRIELVRQVVNRRDNLLTNYGLYAIDEKLLSKTRNFNGGDRQVGSINDSGLLIAMWAKQGYLGLVYFLILLCVQYKKSKKHFILFFILSLTKIHLFTPIFLVYYILSIGFPLGKKKSKYHLLSKPDSV